MSPNSLELFHPLIEKWFREEVGVPTDVQAKAWPEIAEGKHVLVTAPTGSGKTLTAFLWALNQLITGQWELGVTRVLYLSPLKALNNDIRRNLIEPLNALKKVFEEAGKPFPKIRIQTRSGDTSQSDRRKMLRHQPEILITTPESLNLMLSSMSGRSLLMGLESVILDEIHGVLDSRRGTYLMAAVDRLVPLSGEFQRITLSATIRPMETVAAFIGGYQRMGEKYIPREVIQVSSGIQKEYQLKVFFPDILDKEEESDDSVWDPLVEEFKVIIDGNRSTLFFVNNRRLCEKLALKINRNSPVPLAYAHHGSLSREIREEVERKLKAGELRAIIATNSLEMGIDIGSLDEVVLVQSPPAVSSAIQRIGRAGHQVGQKSKGMLFPTHSQDFLEAAVLAKQIQLRDIEPIAPIEKPLDVLAQIILSMVGVEVWDLDALFALLKTSFPYRKLSRREFDLVVHMLAGRYADSRLRELKPRVSLDGIDNTIRARKGALLALYLSGGVIPDRGYFHLRHEQTDARLGELDEEFVWEARVGQVFTLGAQSWRIRKITHNDVFVLPAGPNSPAIPFWIAEDNYRGFHFSEAIGQFLEKADMEMYNRSFRDELMAEHSMNEISADQLLEYLKRQKKITGEALPHRHHLVVEHVESGPETQEGNQIILHTLWGGKVNRPFSLALDAAWEERYHQRLEVFVNNDCVALMVPIEVTAADILSLVSSTRVEELIRRRLEGSGFFGARFRECAGRAMLVNRSKFNQRVPLWMTRLKSQKLMESVLHFEDFPVLLESWRTCFRDEFDIVSLKLVLSEIECGVIQCSETKTSTASPFGQSASWRQVNQYMYKRDDAKADKTSNLNKDLLKEVVFDETIRPAVPQKIMESFVVKRQRLLEGYRPESSEELLDWIKERIFLSREEFKTVNPYELAGEELPKEVSAKLLWVKPQWAKEPLVVAREFAAGLRRFYRKVEIELTDWAGIALDFAPSDEINISQWFGEWLSFFGPLSKNQIQDRLGLPESLLESYLDELIEAEQVITGHLIEESDEVLICDATNYEFLLRQKRAQATPPFEALPIAHLGLFLAEQQGLLKREEDMDGFLRQMDRLLLYPMTAGLWESEIFPARMNRYQPSFMDSTMQEGDFIWWGLPGQKIVFSYTQDLDLWGFENEDEVFDDNDLIEEEGVKMDFAVLKERSNLSQAELHEKIWESVWQTKISNDGFSALRKGLLNQFKLPKALPATSSRSRRGRAGTGSRSQFERWQGALPLSGNWFRLAKENLGEDLLGEEELKKDRVRLLFDRYGILFRELLLRESPVFQWRNLFRTLRIMELSGEIFSGYFFENIQGPQFITPGAFRKLQRLKGDSCKEVYWLSAQDPISLCGVALDKLKGKLPKRVGSHHLVYRGVELILVSQRLGKEIDISISPDDETLLQAFGVFEHLLTRQFQPLSKLKIETINGEKASSSEYLPALKMMFDVVLDYKEVILYKRYQ